MANYVLFSRCLDAGVNRQANAKARELGLNVVSAWPGSMLVEGESAKVRAAAKQLPGDWDCAREQRAMSMPEKKPLPAHRKLKAARTG